MTVANSDFRVRNGIHVTDNAVIVGNTAVGNNLTVNGNITSNGTLHTLSGNSTLGTRTLHVNATNLRVAVNATSTTTTTNTAIDWAFEVVGKQRVTSNLSVGGTTVFDDTVTVGAAANNATRKQLVVTGNVVAQSSLTVTGNTTLSGNGISIGGGATPLTTITGDVLITGTIKTGATGNFYDLDDLNAEIDAVPILKVYNVAGTQVFP
jgi:hypothetical protein